MILSSLNLYVSLGTVASYLIPGSISACSVRWLRRIDRTDRVSRMQLLIATFVLLSLAQFMTATARGIKLSSTQGQNAKAQASEKQAEAERLRVQVIRLYGEGKFDEALPLANRVLELSEVAVGPADAA